MEVRLCPTLCYPALYKKLFFFFSLRLETPFYSVLLFVCFAVYFVLRMDIDKVKADHTPPSVLRHPSSTD